MKSIGFAVLLMTIGLMAHAKPSKEKIREANPDTVQTITDSRADVEIRFETASEKERENPYDIKIVVKCKGKPTQKIEPIERKEQACDYAGYTYNDKENTLSVFYRVMADGKREKECGYGWTEIIDLKVACAAYKP